MRKIFIALAASLLITVGSAVRINQVPARHLLEEGSGETKEHRPRKEHRREEEEHRREEEHEEHHDNEHWEGVEEGHKWEENHEGEHKETKNAQGILGLVEETVNIGDKVAQTVDPAIPTVNLSNKGSVVTLKVAGKLAEADSQWNLKSAMKKGINNALDYQPGANAQTESEGILGLVEGTVNIGDKVAQTLDPSIPSINLSNKGDVVTLKVAGKLAEADSQWGIHMPSAPHISAPSFQMPSLQQQAQFVSAMQGRPNPGMFAEVQSEGIINALENALGSTNVNLAVSDKVGQPPEVKGAVSFKLAQSGAEGIINAIEQAVGSANVNLAVTDKVGQPPVVKGAVSFKLA